MNFAGLPVNPLWLPIYFAQGQWTRLRTPRLPDAAGPGEGLITGLVNGRAAALRLLVIGDSTVAGVGAATQQTALAGRIAWHLQQATHRTVQWRALGQTSATAVTLHQQLVPRIAPNSADVVVISCGVNDVTRMHTPAQWEANLRTLLQALRARLGAVPVLHAGVPPLGLFPALPHPLRHWIGARATAFAAIAQTLMAHETLTAYAGSFSHETLASGFARDGYHPNESSYELWGKHLAQQLCQTWPAVGES